MNARHWFAISTLLAASLPLTVNADEQGPAASPVIAKVRAATAAFRDPNAALAAGYIDTGNCVSSRDSGAMGVHFVNPALLFDDGSVDLSTPEILVYEPMPGGRLQLVAAEYVSFDDGNPDTGSPVLAGQLFNYTGAPNRYGLPPHHELHIWAWKPNPNGTFADFNPLVSCDAYEGPSGMGGH